MERILNKTNSFKEAEDWDVLQHIGMTPEQRQDVAARLRERVYGIDVPDVKEAQEQK